MAGLLSFTRAFLQMARIRETSPEVTLASFCMFHFCTLLPLLLSFSVNPVRRGWENVLGFSCKLWSGENYRARQPRTVSPPLTPGY